MKLLKIMAFVLSFVLVFSLFISCNTGTVQNEQSETDPVTPKLKIDENNFWCVSYDNGENWTSLDVKATGEQGEQGEKGDKGDKGDVGTNGITPQLKLNENAFWCVSYDNGATWTTLDVRGVILEEVVDTKNKLKLTLLEDYTYAVEGFSEEGCTVLNIPAYYNGVAVTKILNTAFKGNTDITEVNIPGTMKEINQSEFEGCTNIEKLNIGEGVELIQAYAFYGCTKLKSVIIPDSMKAIGSHTFAGCSALESVKFGANLEYIIMNAFYGTALTSVTFPNKVKQIDQESFAECPNLTSVTIPASVGTIGYDAFNSPKLSTINYCGSEEQWKSMTTNPYKNFENINYNYIVK